MQIKILPQQLISQIAAGEVIERPASVVKELLENSLDAGSSRISIEIKEGGSQLIKISDNGCGIAKEELLLALTRHATSKISSLEDLEHIVSLGFRGEALASINSVSRLTMASRVAESAMGWRITANGAEAEPIMHPTAHPIGTTVEVHDLFFNTPARRKFLRSSYTEFNYIEEVVRRIALSNFSVEVSLKHNAKNILDMAPAVTQIEQEKRVANLCGKTFIENAVHISNTNSDLSLSGWISLPTFSRRQSDLQYLYLNGRMVRDKILSHAVREAYQDTLFLGRQPAFVLYLTIDPATVDVNVHPTKQEARFSDSRLVHDFVATTVKQALAKVRPKTMQPELTAIKETIFARDSWTRIEEPKTEEVEQQSLSMVQETKADYQVLQQDRLIESPLGFALAQLHGIYILAQNTKGLVLIDAHAAQERIVYEQLKNDYAKQSLQPQQLLLPVTLTLSSKEVSCIDHYKEVLQELGIGFDALGPETIVVRQVPYLLRTANIEQLIRDILSDLITHDRSTLVAEYINEILVTVACHGSIRANRILTLAEMNALLRSLEQTDFGGQCSHGRPTYREITLAELNVMFKRT